MFIRKKIVKGTAYYQVVENVRKDRKPRQVLVVALGRHSSVVKARFRARLLLNRLNERRAQLGESSAADRRERTRLDGYAAKTQERIDIMTRIIDGGLVPPYVERQTPAGGTTRN